MAGIAGIANPKQIEVVETMLERISYRGNHVKTIPVPAAVFGMVYSDIQPGQVERIKRDRMMRDDVGNGHFACAQLKTNDLILSRDLLGVAPLYYGHDAQGDLCFASEVKGLLGLADTIHELPPGSRLANGKLESIQISKPRKILETPSAIISAELRVRLTEAVKKRVHNSSHIGCLLSGGLDSTAITALARPFAEKLDTFVAGLEGAPDLLHARKAAWYLKSRHHERVVKFEDMLTVLPDVIYHLESFDALLVRSSIMHYLAAQMASDYISAIFSGEGGDELFAGYAYLKDISLDMLPQELEDITLRLHNTALQRVDRCTMAHGVTPWVPFLDPDVYSYALQIPAKYKMHHGTEKWILRQAVKDLLPIDLVERPKAKFWEGAGVGRLIDEYSEQAISDADFIRERLLPNGWKLNTKEELLYYRIFSEHFGTLHNLDWMGRTKKIPVQ